MEMDAATAFARFGLGRRRGEAVPADVRGWLRGQLLGPDTAPTAGLASTADALGRLHDLGRAKEAAKADPARQPDVEAAKAALKDMQRAELTAFLANALVTGDGFRERLVWFWCNHFTVAARNPRTAALLGPYVREAIRPHVTGRFQDMLLAVMRHPAMLSYLDQARSMGPDSQVGMARHLGLNENLARECLELHTVTPAAGYTQADVTNFAKVLTGWSVEAAQAPVGFKYRPGFHEPGRQLVMGQLWPEGEAGGVELLAFLGTHPATYRHLAEKLVRHFAADTPRAQDVAFIEDVLRSSGGDLGAAARALIELPDAWLALTKLRAPLDYVVACLRSVGAHPDAEPQVLGTIANLGEPVFRAPFPIGWPDRAADWASPAAMLQRVDFAYQFAGRVTDQEPVDVAGETLGPLLTAETGAEIRRAGSRRDALTLFLASPEMQRR